MNRPVVPFALLLLLGTLAACSSASTTAPPSAALTATSASAAPSEAPTPSEAMTPSESPTPEPVAVGTATDFCGAFQELTAVSDAPTMDVATFGSQFRAAAADMRKFAPAEIEKAANTYADVIDSIGKSAMSGAMDQTALSTAVSDAMAGNAADIGTTAQWVATNCNL